MTTGLFNFGGKLELLFQNFTLISLFFRLFDPVIIEADFADGDDLILESSGKLLAFRQRAAGLHSQ